MRLRLLAATLLLAATAVHATPVAYQLDASHTQVHFSWSHNGFSHPVGRFDRFDARFLFDAEDPTRSSLTVTLPIDSIDTGVPALDEHLKSPDFFDAARYPTATFRSTKVERSGDNTLRVSGELTLRGVTKPVVLDVTVNKLGESRGQPAAGFDATATLKRSEFGVDRFLPNIADDIALRITTEAAVPKPAPAQ